MEAMSKREGFLNPCPECGHDGRDDEFHFAFCSQNREGFHPQPRKHGPFGWPSEAEIDEMIRATYGDPSNGDPIKGDPITVTQLDNRTGDANPKKAMGDTKLRMDLLPPAALIEMAKALQYGALYAKKKDGSRGYGEWNWRETNIDYKTYLAGLVRHIERCIEREDFDPDSRAHVLGHVMAGCAIVLDAQACGTLVDNRPQKSAPIAKLMTDAVTWVKSWSK